MGESSWNGYEHNCLFSNLGGGQFADVSRPVGSDDTRDGRAVAIADLDGDGRLDVAINNNNAAPTIYLNRTAAENNWLEVEVRGNGRTSSRDAVGARVALTLADEYGAPGKTMTRWVEAGSGYAAQSAFPVHFGLGPASAPYALEVTWPSGETERLEGEALDALGINRVLRLEERDSAIARARGGPGSAGS